MLINWREWKCIGLSTPVCDPIQTRGFPHDYKPQAVGFPYCMEANLQDTANPNPVQAS